VTLSFWNKERGREIARGALFAAVENTISPISHWYDDITLRILATMAT
jgi:hypothetical protein